MFRKLYVFIRRKSRQVIKNKLSKKEIAELGDKKFVIVSNNCWGGEIYQWYKKPYNSPFIGLFLFGPCYLKMLSNFEYYMRQDLNFVKTSSYPDPLSYPLAKLDDIEIHFVHYKNEEEARDKWNRRTSRMQSETNKDNYFFKICDRERTSEKQLIEFHQLPFKNKISFGVNNPMKLKTENHIKIFESDKNKKKYVPNGKKLFKLTFLYFDLNKWLLR